MDSIVAVVTSQPSREAVAEGFPRHMPIRLNPCLEPFARTLQFLASRTALDARHSLSVFFPEKFAAQKGAPARQAGMQATEAQDAGLRRRHLQCEFPQSLRERLVKPCRSAAEPKGADQVIGVAAYQGLASTTGFDHLFKPQVQCIMSGPIGQHRGDHPALGCPGVRVNHPAVGLQHARFQPRPDQAEKGPVIDAQAPASSAASHGPCGRRSLQCRPPPQTHPARMAGHRSGHGPHPLPRLRAGPHHDWPETPAQRSHSGCWRRLPAGACLRSTGRPSGLSWPSPFGMS